MAEVIRMPRMSDTMTEGVFVEWHKKVGDKVKSGDVLAEVETDKATMELESYNNGVLLYVGVEKGKAAPVDSVIAIIGKEGEDYKELLAKESTADTSKENKDEHKSAPKEVSEEKTENKSAEKKNVEEEKPEVKVKEVEPQVKELKEEDEQTQADENGRVKASPLAKMIAKEKGVDLAKVEGSGDGGRIVKKDIESYTPAADKKEKSLSFAPVTGEEGYTDAAVSQMRKTIASRLAQSKFAAPHFYLTVSIDMDNAIAARKSMNAVAPVKISFNDMIVKACATALRQHPQVNSSWLGDLVRTYKHIHIGIAVAINDGLVVPVIRHVDGKSLAQISVETGDLAERARNRKLQPQDWEGNTFTISNLGMMGIEEFTAIINPPDACILAVGGINEVPVVKNGQIVPGNIMKLTMSCDHRVVDGATGAKFLQTLKDFLEDPVRMLI
ncbi:MAG: pyruvate dehydrogenase complex dihydrolipoamide acetyltransferase [Bacteroidetes bacterium]|nr:pyruvate dehydrogenase complex dihydrolipoamide acetyltransferase [Bacteroidota bacterium]